MSEIPEQHIEIDWEDVYVKLFAYADFLLNSKSWFRKDSGVYLKGREVSDYVMEAITKYLEKPENYDSTKGKSLIGYLKEHILRTLIGNDANAPENKRTKVIKASTTINSSLEDDDILDAIGPSVQAWFDDEIDFKAVMDHIQDQVKDDPDAEKIFLGCCLDTLKPREVMEVFQMTPTEYNNGFRRLNTIRRNTAKTFGIKSINI